MPPKRGFKRERDAAATTGTQPVSPAPFQPAPSTFPGGTTSTVFHAKQLYFARQVHAHKRNRIGSALEGVPVDVQPTTKDLLVSSEVSSNSEKLTVSVAQAAPIIESKIDGACSSQKSLVRAAIEQAQLFRLLLSTTENVQSATPCIRPPPSSSSLESSVEPRAAALVRTLVAAPKNGSIPPSYLGARPVRFGLSNDASRAQLLLDMVPEEGVPYASAPKARARADAWRVPVAVDVAALTGDAPSDPTSPPSSGLVHSLWDPFDPRVTPLQYAHALLEERGVIPALYAPAPPGPRVPFQLTKAQAVAVAVGTQLLAQRARVTPAREQIVATLAGLLSSTAPALAARWTLASGAGGACGSAPGPAAPLAGLAVRLPDLLSLVGAPDGRPLVVTGTGEQQAAAIEAPAKVGAGADAVSFAAASSGASASSAPPSSAVPAAASVEDLGALSASELLFGPRTRSAVLGPRGSRSAAGYPAGHVGTLAPEAAPGHTAGTAAGGLRGDPASVAAHGLVPALPPWAPRVHPTRLLRAWLHAPDVDLGRIPLQHLATGQFEALPPAAPQGAADVVVIVHLFASGVASPAAAGKDSAAEQGVAVPLSLSALAADPAAAVEAAAEAAAVAVLGRRGHAEARALQHAAFLRDAWGAANDVATCVAYGAPDATTLQGWLQAMRTRDVPATSAAAPAAGTRTG